MDETIIRSLLNTFMVSFTAGGDRLVPYALGLLFSIAVIEIALIGLWTTWGEYSGWTGMCSKLLGIVFVAALIRQWHTLTFLVIRGCIEIGLLAGGDQLKIVEFTDPTKIAGYGFIATANLFERLMMYNGLDAIKYLIEVIIAAPIGFFIVMAYFGLAIFIFITLLDFYIHAALTTILLPFVMNARVAFLADRAINIVLADGIRLLVLAFITSATWMVLKAQQPPLNPTLKMLFGQLLGAMAVCALAWRADKSTQTYLSGMPQLSTADAVHFVRATLANFSRVGMIMNAARAPLASMRRGATPQRRT